MHGVPAFGGSEWLAGMKLVYKLGLATGILALAGVGISAEQIAILRNGFTIRHDRRESREEMTRLYFAESVGGYVEIPNEDIVGFETEEPLPIPTRVASPAPAITLGDVVGAASRRNKIDPVLVMSLIRAESAFHSNAVSPKGAQGLMQLMPQTASNLGVRDALDPTANVEGGIRYLRQMLDRYDNDLSKALAAYNAGPARVDQYRGVPPYAETRAYISRIIGDYNRMKLAERRTGGNVLQNAKATGRNSGSQSSRLTTAQ